MLVQPARLLPVGGDDSRSNGINYVHCGLPQSYTLTPYFQDVPATNPCFPFIQRLADLNFADTCQTTPAMFCPTQTETQAQMAKLMILGWMHANNLTTFTYSLSPYFTDVPASNADFSTFKNARYGILVELLGHSVLSDHRRSGKRYGGAYHAEFTRRSVGL